MKHFPFFLLFILLLSCHWQKDDDHVYKLAIKNAEDFYKNSQNDSAFYYYNKAYQSTDFNNTERKIYSAAMMAMIQNQNGDYTGAEQTLTEVVFLEKRIKNKAYLIQLYNEYGKSFRMQKNYFSAIENYNKCLAINQDNLFSIILRNNLAVVYLDLKQPQKAIDLLLPTLTEEILEKDIATKSRVLDNLGLAYLKVGKKTEALNYLNQGLSLREKINDPFQTTNSYIHLATYYEKNDPKAMMTFAEKALESAKVSKNPDDQLEALNLLIKNPSNPNLIEHFTEFAAISDSLYTTRQQDKNQFAKIKWDYKQILSESKFQKNLKLFFLILFFMAIVIAFIGLLYIKKRNKLKLHQSVYDTETRLSKKLHDELANDVFQTLTFVENKNLDNKLDRNKLLDYLEKIYQQTRNISRDNSDIDLTENYFESLLLMINNYNSENINLIVKTNQIQVLKIKKPIKVILYRVMQELLINMKKHSQAHVVFVTFRENLKNYEITYADNGMGCDINLLEKNGLKNVENRIFSIGGLINFDSLPKNGFKATIIIPK